MPSFENHSCHIPPFKQSKIDITELNSKQIQKEKFRLHAYKKAKFGLFQKSFFDFKNLFYSLTFEYHFRFENNFVTKIISIMQKQFRNILKATITMKV